jgi:hypothetical protein
MQQYQEEEHETEARCDTVEFEGLESEWRFHSPFSIMLN